jgi:hypothetical protein
LKNPLSDVNLHIKDIEKAISNLEAEQTYQLLKKQFERFSDNPESINLQEVWKVLKKVCPKQVSTVPMAKKNHKGDLVTNCNELKKLLAKEYKQRLRNRPVRGDLIGLKKRRKEIFDLQLRIAEETSSEPWSMDDLDRALKDLKNNKARDHAGYVNEIFKHGVIGTDLKKSLLLMLNKLKVNNLIPTFMRFANITTVPKKGSLTVLENERGIFRVDIVRSILMRIIYNEKYPLIDSNMSDGQMGGRKGKG